MSAARNLADARTAKSQLAASLSAHPEVNGVGIQPVEGGYALIVNLLSEESDVDVPDEVDGVDVRVEVTGPGFPQGAGGAG